ncbi:MAG: lipoyl synthase [candidate division WOR-3 bacterium]|nr:MAG: lipoyl synthase [candidate division WOR-3 bacterium]
MADTGPGTVSGRKPEWLRMKLASGEVFENVAGLLARHRLHTVCTSARCPNLSECWNRGTATFMILGETCTRHCGFCSVKTGNPHREVDEDEPQRVAQAARELGLRYVVLTSVDRDDLEDLGSGMFAHTVTALKRPADSSVAARPQNNRGPVGLPRVEVLTPDFGARKEPVQKVVEAGPDVFGHNIETVERLSPEVRDRRASYRTSLEVLCLVKELRPGMLTKSGLMAGLGETDEEVERALHDLRAAGCDIVTIGQYLQPDRRCLPVQRYVEPSQFEKWHEEAQGMGFRAALCGPLVRSSYLAESVLAESC